MRSPVSAVGEGLAPLPAAGCSIDRKKVRRTHRICEFAEHFCGTRVLPPREHIPAGHAETLPCDQIGISASFSPIAAHGFLLFRHFDPNCKYRSWNSTRTATIIAAPPGRAAGRHPPASDSPADGSSPDTAGPRPSSSPRSPACSRPTAPSG